MTIAINNITQIFTEINLLITIKLKVERNCNYLAKKLKKITLNPLIKGVLYLLFFVIYYGNYLNKIIINV